jgi:hypothetical protein
MLIVAQQQERRIENEPVAVETNSSRPGLVPLRSHGGYTTAPDLRQPGTLTFSVCRARHTACAALVPRRALE